MSASRIARHPTSVVALLVGILLAVFVVDGAWEWVVVGTGAAIELGETALLFWWSKRRRSVVGAEALVGRTATVAADCRPEGQVRVAGELWRARCAEGASAGEEVVVAAVDGLVLDVVRR
jgi:membrane protein implicated in regulation of membrane protease activity